jgi:type III secretion system YscD/HrpQ family protein
MTPSEKTTGLLKILSGNQLGAEVAIAGGTTLTIGRSEENDIVLTDAAVALHHAKISVSASGEFTLETLEGACSVEGRAATSNPVSLGAFQVFTLGSTHLAIAREGAEWPALRLPVLRTIGGLPVKRTTVPESPGAAPAPSRRNRLLVLSGLVAVVAAGALWVAFGAGKTSRPQPFVLPSKIHHDQPANSGQNSIAQVFKHEVMEKVPSAQLEISFRDGRPAVKVFVDRENEAARIRRIANALPEPILLSTVARDQMAVSLRIFLQANNIQTLTPQISAPALVSWTGYLQNRAVWAGILKQIQNDIPDAHNVDGGIVFGESLVTRISEVLQKTGFAATVRASVADSGIHLEGSVAADRQADWQSARSEIETLVGSHVPLVAKIDSTTTSTPGRELVLDAPIVTVNLEGLPYVQLANGTRLYQGARLANGFVLESLDASKLIFAGPAGRSTVEIFKDRSDTDVVVNTTDI